jgi:hypothetical protein
MILSLVTNEDHDKQMLAEGETPLLRDAHSTRMLGDLLASRLKLKR